MQQKQLTVLCQAVVSCTLGILGLQMLHSVAPAQTGKEAEADKTLKTTRKTKKPAADSAPSEATAPATAGEKMSKPKKSKSSDVTSSPTSAPAETGEKAMKSKKANRAMPEVTTPPAAAPAEGARKGRAVEAHEDLRTGNALLGFGVSCADWRIHSDSSPARKKRFGQRDLIRQSHRQSLGEYGFRRFITKAVSGTGPPNKVGS